MKSPNWIDRAVVNAVHSEQLAAHGGQDGLRDEGLLESALSRPKNLWAYSSPPPDLPALASTLAFGIARNHPFVDGNKRTAWVLCRTLLLINGVDVAASQEDKYDAVYNLAAGEITEEQFAQWLRDNLRVVE